MTAPPPLPEKKKRAIPPLKLPGDAKELTTAVRYENFPPMNPIITPPSGRASDDANALRQQLGTVRMADLEKLGELGVGSGGVVWKVQHRPTGIIMARKIVHLEVKPETRNQILTELKVMNECSCPFVVGFYGSFSENRDINILMEYMDGGSLDRIVSQGIRIPETILGKITVAVLQGLTYLKEQLNILHRDIKPSNILVNSRGEVKLCDFGVSGTLINSMANSFVGSRSYMSPERIVGLPYTITSDLWSLGLSLMELALGRYPIPFPSQDEFRTAFQSGDAAAEPIQVIPDFALLAYIVDSPAPTFPEGIVSQEFKDFIDRCLEKDPLVRPDLSAMMQHPFIVRSQQESTDLAEWVCRVKNLKRGEFS
ncbi:dual specificity mitogen-activated protein kinase kinase 1-like [Paramacrobiotus metropolitanus]|uniref:dual specificity mitogen-activated protein kinase kinase 1-like n=1 Tax=Paramacrobiotus metropolitanus TaxID=2943436 RepID=UPI0024462CF3|nr:dual specificity mitogen-activated protein kinase kinase 1-like [Paramacrobiotus metropolitanus]